MEGLANATAIITIHLKLTQYRMSITIKKKKNYRHRQNVKPETIKLLEKTGENLCDSGLHYIKTA